jgi:hypothetical protein
MTYMRGPGTNPQVNVLGVQVVATLTSWPAAAISHLHGTHRCA